MLLSTKTKSEKFLLHKDKQFFQSTSLAEIKEMKSKEKAAADVDGSAINKYTTLIALSGETNRKSQGLFNQKIKQEEDEVLINSPIKQIKFPKKRADTQ